MHPIQLAVVSFTVANRRDMAVLLVRSGGFFHECRPTLADHVLHERRRPAPTWLQQQLAGA